jgi:hypothetical protein
MGCPKGGGTKPNRVSISDSPVALILSPTWPLAAQPLHHFRRGASVRGVEQQMAVVSNPVQITTAFEEVLSRCQLAAMACTPERIGDLVRHGWWKPSETLLDSSQS